jgi:hypothetical protein
MKKCVKLVLILMIAGPLIGAAVSSCAGESDCSTAGRAMLWSAVYKSGGSTAEVDTIDALTVTTLPENITLLNRETNVTRFGLPLRYTNDTTTWIFHYDEQTSDTIVIRHANTPQFVSMDCGYEMKQVVLGLSVTKHKLDTIRVTNSTTNTDGTKNLEIYFR